MRKLFVSSLLCTVGLLPSAVLAQLSVPKVEVGVFGQYTKLDSKVKIDNPIALGAQLSFPLYKWLGVEGNAQYGATKSNITPFGSVKYSPLHAFATLSVPVASKAALILGGGGGVSIYKGHRTGNESEEHGSALVGLKLCGSGKWGARIDGVGDFTPLPDDYPPYGKSSNWGGRIGVTYALHGACAASAKKFDWKLAAAGAAAPLARGASRQVALSAADDDTHPIEVRKVNNLVCSSSDPNVATVDNSGNVKAVRYGTATITCKGLVKDIERSANYTVNVPAPAWTFALTPATQTRDVGQTANAATTARDADNVDLGAATTWASGNTTVATVNNAGVVTCRSGGSAVITATKTAYGSSKSASTTVVCTAPPPPPPAPPQQARMIRLDSTQFVFDQAALLQSGTAMLQTVIDAMKKDPTIRVSVEGHTDWYGDESYNETLAMSRATRIATQLRKLGGKDIAADRISMRGYGERCLLVRDGDPDRPAPRPKLSAANKSAQAPNRRVEIWQLLPNETGSPTECRSEAQRAGRVKFEPNP